MFRPFFGFITVRVLQGPPCCATNVNDWKGQFWATLEVVRFEVLTAVSMKMIAFWAVALSSPEVADRNFRGAYCLHHQGDYHCTSKTSVYFQETTWHYIPESCIFRLEVIYEGTSKSFRTFLFARYWYEVARWDLTTLYPVLQLSDLDCSWSPPSVCKLLLSHKHVSASFNLHQRRTEKCRTIFVGRRC
jgi:hypothetical protein